MTVHESEVQLNNSLRQQTLEFSKNGEKIKIGTSDFAGSIDPKRLAKVISDVMESGESATLFCYVKA